MADTPDDTAEQEESIVKANIENQSQKKDNGPFDDVDDTLHINGEAKLGVVA